MSAELADNVLRTVLSAASVYLMVGLLFAYLNERSKW